MEFKEFVKLYERIKPLGNMTPKDATQGYATKSEKPLGMVIPTGPFGAMSTQWTGSQWGDDALRSGGYMGTNWVNNELDLGLPTVSKTSKIQFIDKNKTIRVGGGIQGPILVVLQDRTKLYIPFDVFKSIITPEVGRTIVVTFQRRKDDGSINHSRIQSLKCF